MFDITEAMRLQLIHELAAWIDTTVLAEALVDSLIEVDEIECNALNAQEVWNRFLENQLPEALEIEARPIYQARTQK